MNDLQTLNSKRIIHAVILGVMAALCYSIMNLLVKLFVGDTTVSMIVFFRCVVALSWLTLILFFKRLRGEHFTIKTKHFGLHLLRAISGFIVILSFFYALQYVPLADATSLAMTYTLFIPILSFIFLGTKTSLKSWLALLIGFIGIIFILKPYGDNFNPMVLVVLITSISTAVSLLGIHELLKRNEDPFTILLYFFSLTLIFSGICTIFSWKTPSLTTLIYLFLIGAIGAAYQELLTRSLSYAPPKIVSPLLYFSVIFSCFFDWIFWARIPDLYFWIGMTLVAFGCIFSIKYAKS